MKPFAILLLANISFPVFAQDYLITFTGSGASTTVDSVKVENLSQCTSLSMAGSDTLLLQTVVGMDEVSDGNDFSLRISPNPSPGVLTVSITTSINCNTILSVFDLSGKILLSREEGLARGCNTFVLTGIPAGFYFLTAGSGRSLQKVTFISTAAGAGTPGLHRIGSESGTVKDHPVSNNPEGSGYRSGRAVVTMQFNPGDTLKLTGRSGIYRTVSMLFPTSSHTVTFSFVGCTDTDGNHYAVVQIGSQLWMQENLKTTKYRDGTDIPNVTDSATWANLTTGAYCNFHNLPEEGEKYGWLYRPLCQLPECKRGLEPGPGQ